MLAVATAVVYFWVRYRRKKQGDVQPEFFPDVISDDVPDIIQEETKAPAEPTFKPDEPDAPTPVQTPEINAEEEASVYMAYGRYERAKQVLESAIADAPDRLKLKVMLLECFISLEDQPGFNHVFNNLPEDLDKNEPELWEKVLNLEKNAPWHAKAKPKPVKTIEAESATQEEPVEKIDVTIDETAESIPTVNELQTKDALTEQSTELESQEEDEHIIQFDLGEKDTQPSEQTEDVSKTEAATEDNLKDAATKLDLAKVYIEMGDTEEARKSLDDVLAEGSEAQIEEAKNLIDKL